LSARKDYRTNLPGTRDPDELKQRLGRTPRETLRKAQQDNKTSRLNMFLGAQVGCIGETSALALIVGGLILLATGTIRWYIPVSFIGTVALLGWLLPVRMPALNDVGQVYAGWVWVGGDPLFEIFAGGVMLGALFMATDMVTSPLTRTGKLIFGVGCGLLTVVIRKYGGYPEGVCYAILLMNTAVPLIDSSTKPRVYGTGKQ
jgi:electron transport complex protein RnfD